MAPEQKKLNTRPITDKERRKLRQAEGGTNWRQVHKTQEFFENPDKLWQPTISDVEAANEAKRKKRANS
jgi:hypothetical protein